MEIELHTGNRYYTRDELLIKRINELEKEKGSSFLTQLGPDGSICYVPNPEFLQKAQMEMADGVEESNSN